MGQMPHVEEIAVVLLVLLATFFGEWKTRQAMAEVNRSSERERQLAPPA